MQSTSAGPFCIVSILIVHTIKKKIAARGSPPPEVTILTAHSSLGLNLNPVLLLLLLICLFIESRTFTRSVSNCGTQTNFDSVLVFFCFAHRLTKFKDKNLRWINQTINQQRPPFPLLPQSSLLLVWVCTSLDTVFLRKVC